MRLQPVTGRSWQSPPSCQLSYLANLAFTNAVVVRFLAFWRVGDRGAAVRAAPQDFVAFFLAGVVPLVL